MGPTCLKITAGAYQNQMKGWGKKREVLVLSFKQRCENEEFGVPNTGNWKGSFSSLVNRDDRNL